MSTDRVDEISIFLLRDALEGKDIDLPLLQTLTPLENFLLLVQVLAYATQGVRLLAKSKGVEPERVVDLMIEHMRSTSYQSS